MRAAPAEEPPPPSPLLRWLVVWALLALVYVSALFLHRALVAEKADWWTLGREDLAHLAGVPLVETGALALVVRLRRRP